MWGATTWPEWRVNWETWKPHVIVQPYLDAIESSITDRTRILIFNDFQNPTGAEALAEMEREVPDLIILDIGLPDMDGYELLREIRKDPECRDIPAIAVTANAMLDDVKRGEDAGFDQYMVKPVRASELLQAIEQIIE